MALPLPAYQSMGQMIQNSLNQNVKSAQQVEALKNAIIQNQFTEPLTQANIAQKQAETNKMLFQQRNPLYGLPGTAGQLGAAELIRQNPELVSDPNALNMLNRSIAANLGARETQQQLMAKQAAGYDFNSLPVGTKEYVLAQAAGMGIYPDDARKMLTSGKSLSDIAVEKGFDPNSLPEPIYPLTKAGQNQLKQRQSAIAELGVLGKTISEWAGPYSQQIAGYSPLQVRDALTGKNKDQQAKFLAARMLAPEQAAIRLRAMGGNVGIEAIREMTDKAMVNGKNLQFLVKPEVFNQANDYVENAIYDAVQAANKSATKAIGSPEEKPSTAKEAIKKTAKEFKGESLRMQGPDGKVYNVPQGKAQLFVENGFKRIG